MCACPGLCDGDEYPPLVESTDQEPQGGFEEQKKNRSGRDAMRGRRGAVGCLFLRMSFHSPFAIESRKESRILCAALSAIAPQP